MKEKKQINVEVGKNLKELRESEGYTQEKLSELMEITSNHLSTIERGVCGMSPEHIKKVCEIFGISSDILIFGQPQTDNVTMEFARKFSTVKPQYRSPVYKILNELKKIGDLEDEEESEK